MGLIILIFIGAGCAAQSGRAARPTQVLDLGAGKIEVDPSGELPPGFWDSYTLMKEGNTLFDRGRYSEAASYFNAAAERFAGEETASLALFNLGACYEKMGDYELALRSYKALEKTAGPKISPQEILTRQLSCLEELGRWTGAVVVCDRLRGLPDLPEPERIDVSLRRGVALYKNGDPEAGKNALKKALMDYRIFERRQLPTNKYFAARGYFFLGEIYFESYEAIALNERGDELRLQLEAKADYLYLARMQYLRSMRTYEGRWLAASLHKLGYGYETLYFSMKNAPLPEDLSESQIGEYKKKLEKRISNLLKKAVDAYERNADLDKRFELQSPWAEKSRERLKYLRQYCEGMRD